jgi:hypothetical protein
VVVSSSTITVTVGVSAMVSSSCIRVSDASGEEAFMVSSLPRFGDAVDRQGSRDTATERRRGPELVHERRMKAESFQAGSGACVGSAFLSS